jgi:hypothetical protein
MLLLLLGMAHMTISNEIDLYNSLLPKIIVMKIILPLLLLQTLLD